MARGRAATASATPTSPEAVEALLRAAFYSNRPQYTKRLEIHAGDEQQFLIEIARDPVTVKHMRDGSFCACPTKQPYCSSLAHVARYCTSRMGMFARIPTAPASTRMLQTSSPTMLQHCSRLTIPLTQQTGPSNQQLNNKPLHHQQQGRRVSTWRDMPVCTLR
jgi:hypothetical protein